MTCQAQLRTQDETKGTVPGAAGAGRKPRSPAGGGCSPRRAPRREQAEPGRTRAVATATAPTSALSLEPPGRRSSSLNYNSQHPLRAQPDVEAGRGLRQVIGGLASNQWFRRTAHARAPGRTRSGARGG